MAELSEQFIRLALDLEREDEDAIRQWRALPDSKMWEDMGDNCDRQNLTLEQQLMLVTYIKSMSPDPGFFVWTSKDRDAVVNVLVTAYNTPAMRPAIYRSIGMYRYNNQPLPRKVAAECCELALQAVLHSHG